MKPTIRPVRTREAKDFLVAQTTEQAALEGVPLSDLEKRMMYFTESDGAIEDPFKLKEEFEAPYDSEVYESKASKLLHHAHAKAKKENAEVARLWSEAFRVLSKGDRYILVLWNQESTSERPPYDSLKLLGSAIVVSCLFLTISAFSDRMSRVFPHFPIPGWILRRLVLIFLVVVFLCGDTWQNGEEPYDQRIQKWGSPSVLAFTPLFSSVLTASQIPLP